MSVQALTGKPPWCVFKDGPDVYHITAKWLACAWMERMGCDGIAEPDQSIGMMMSCVTNDGFHWSKHSC